MTAIRNIDRFFIFDSRSGKFGSVSYSKEKAEKVAEVMNEPFQSSCILGPSPSEGPFFARKGFRK